MVAGLTASETVAGQVLDPGAALRTYSSVFQMIGWAGVGAGVVLLVLSPILGKMAHGDIETRFEPEIGGSRQEYDRDPPPPAPPIVS
jgi:POT family proton-dependent oligopeptide transporter